MDGRRVAGTDQVLRGSPGVRLLPEDTPDRASTPPLIVLVEDNREILEAMRLCLEGEGYRVLGVGDPSVATQVIAAARPALVILDLVMWPVSGWEILEAMRSEPGTSRVPVLVCSAAVIQLRERAAHLLARSAVPLPKPFDLDELTEQVGRLIADRRGGSRLALRRLGG